MRLRIGWSAVLPLALLGAACGSSGDTQASTGGVIVSTTAPAPVTSTSSAPGQPVTVKVDAGDYDFHSSVTAFKAGVPYRFEVTNTGTVAHEFMLVEPIAQGMMDMQAMDAMAIGHIEEGDLPAGATATLEVTFDKDYPAGTIEMACHIGEHYQKGMHLDMTVES